MTMMEEVVEFVGTIKDYRFRNADNGFVIATMKVDYTQPYKGKLVRNSYGDIIMKGNFELLTTTDYVIKAKFINDRKYGPQYQYIYSKRKNPIEDMTPEDFQDFLVDLGGKTGELINKEYADAREIFQAHDIDALIKIKGVGIKTAQKLLDKYESQKDMGPALIEFSKWGFTALTTRRLVRFKKSVDAAIKTLKTNPYDFMEAPGIGFKKIDEKAIKMGFADNDPRRVHAFVKDYFDKLEMSGSSWCSDDSLVKYLEKSIFNCDTKETIQWINDSKDFIVYTANGKTRIATKRLFDAEKEVANQLKRIQDGDAGKPLKDIDEMIQRTEDLQGFEYSETQIDGILKLINEKVVLLRGVAGSGKSSTLNAVVRIFKHNGLKIRTCALSGKAADNLSQITGMRGSTIHRLLGIAGDDFASARRLDDVDVVILDEVSMVDVMLFRELVSAMPDHIRFIMVGDSAQLDSIGVGVMRDIVNSEAIPVVTLTEIHRQAKESAIITHSLTYRNGKMPTIDSKKTMQIAGDKKDLGYILRGADEEERLFSDALKMFQKSLEHYAVKDIQIITPLTSNCLRLNKEAQKIVNPASAKKAEYEVYPGKEYGYILREGDKVLNTANNYYTTSVDGNNQMPIFNGNTGEIEKIITTSNSTQMIIKFDGVGTVLLEDKDIKPIQLGYAMTVHKSQGSTIPCVIVMLPFQWALNSRELLYTAITRSSERCFILSSMRTLRSTVSKTSETVHRSNLVDMLREN